MRRAPLISMIDGPRILSFPPPESDRDGISATREPLVFRHTQTSAELPLTLQRVIHEGSLLPR